jgi:hypothetical protein
VTLKFREPTKHSEHQATVGGRGVGPGIAQGFERSASLANRIERVE